MQCGQPIFSNGYPTNGQYCPCTYSLPFNTVNPEVIGEGEVVAVSFPDGSIHFYFIPITKRYMPYPFTPNTNLFSKNSGIYYVRSISNPISPAALTQYCQNIYGAQYSPYTKPLTIADYVPNTPSPGFPLKFHNDDWTSTTDLSYFYPCLPERTSFTPTKASAATQMEITAKDPRNNQQDTRPCSCSRQYKELKQSSEVEMDYSECNRLCKHHSSTSIPKKTSHKSSNMFKKHHHVKLEKQSCQVDCRCPKPSTSDKLVTTYADQACTTNKEAEKLTQTSKSSCKSVSSSPINVAKNNLRFGDIKTEYWIPKQSGNNISINKDSSENILHVFGNMRSSQSCCCSLAEMDSQ